jgi:hypothetical protein
LFLPMPFILRVPGDTLDRRPGSYDDLRRRTARYARDRLAGLTLVNHATQLGITLTPEALTAATRDGTPSALLRAIPVLPALLLESGYVRSTPDRRDHVDIRRVNLRDTRRMHLLAATAEVDGRPVELLFTVRENFGGQGFLDRMSAPHAPDGHRQDGGGTSDDAGAGPPTNADSDSATPAAPDPSSSYYDSAAHRWGVQGASIGAVAGGAAALTGSLALDAPTGGLNLFATPGELAAGAYAGSAIGGGLGWAAGSIKDAYDTLVNSKSGATRPPPGSIPIDKSPWSGDHRDIKSAIGAEFTDDVRISPTGEVWWQNPDGSWTNHGPASSFTGSGHPSGRRGKDRRKER